jgi:hypothetical protein
MPIIVISDSELDEEDEEGHDDDKTLAPPTSQIFASSPEPANRHAGPSKRCGPVNVERLVRGFKQADKAIAREERAECRARRALDDDENDPYGPLF